MNILRTFLSEPDRSTSRRIVLGSTVMEEVWSDMTRTRLPSWITAAPPNWGTANRGKLSAAHWRVICTIHLPITLIRLWREDNGRLKDILDHFMDLVTSIKVANMRISSPRQIDRYNLLIRRYVSPDHHPVSLTEDLYPITTPLFILAMSWRTLGPVHSHSAPFFERYINFFQHINTNRKIGKHTLTCRSHF